MKKLIIFSFADIILSAGTADDSSTDPTALLCIPLSETLFQKQIVILK
jgi:hypothetical protein